MTFFCLSISDLIIISASSDAFSRAALASSASFSATYDSSNAFADAIFSAAVALLKASASISRRVAFDLEISPKELFSPSIASASAVAT